MRVYLCLIAFVGLNLCLTGCSSGKERAGSKVTGKVTFKGEPVVGAKVIFTDGKETSATANGPTAITDESGEYTLVGVKPGSYKVVVYKFTPKKGAILPPDGEGMDMEQMEASGMGSHALPVKYSRPTTTNLAEQVTEGKCVINLELKG